MKHVLFFVDSFFQFIIATQLRLTVYKDDLADIIICNSSTAASELFAELEKSGVYNRCYFHDSILDVANSKCNLIQQIYKCFVYIFALSFPKKAYRRLVCKDRPNYDIFVFNERIPLPECVFNTLRIFNPQLLCYRFADGHTSYSSEYNNAKSRLRRSVESIFRVIFKTYDLEKHVAGYYISNPDLLQIRFKYPVISIPRISRDNSELKFILNGVFKYSKYDDSFEEKYIILEDGMTFFSGNNEDVDIISNICNIVGKENAVVKLHPRSITNRFNKIGVRTTKTGGIPWEVFHMNRSFVGKIFITVCSSAALMSLIYFGDECKTILLYKCVSQRHPLITEKLEAYFAEVINKYGKGILFIPENYVQLHELLISGTV